MPWLRMVTQGSLSGGAGASCTLRPLTLAVRRPPFFARRNAYQSPSFSSGGLTGRSASGRPNCERSRAFKSALGPTARPPYATRMTCSGADVSSQSS